jgi:hypothetical protein
MLLSVRNEILFVKNYNTIPKELQLFLVWQKHLCFRDTPIRRKLERVTDLMSRMVVGGGVFDE